MAGDHADVALFSATDSVRLTELGIQPVVSMAPVENPTVPDIPTLKELGYDVEWCSGK